MAASRGSRNSHQESKASRKQDVWHTQKRFWQIIHGCNPHLQLLITQMCVPYTCVNNTNSLSSRDLLPRSFATTKENNLPNTRFPVFQLNVCISVLEKKYSKQYFTIQWLYVWNMSHECNVILWNNNTNTIDCLWNYMNIPFSLFTVLQVHDLLRMFRHDTS